MKKNLIWIIIAVVTGFYLVNRTDSGFAVPQQTAKLRSHNGIEQIEFLSLFDNKKSFPQIASNEHYTVVEVYLDSCSICKRLEKGFRPFLDKRKDVVIKRIHFPESGINFTFTSQQEADEIQARMESYRVCGTPHIEIYGPDKNLIAGDICGSKQGTNFLRQWISAETGMSRMFL